MKIRKAAPRDIPDISVIYEKIHAAEENGYMEVGWKRDVYPTVNTARNALHRDDLFVLLDDADTLVGAAIINRIQAEGYEKGHWKHPAEEQDIMVLHTLVISPDEQDKGYGKAFAQFYEDYALKNGCHHLRIDTNAKNARARQFYNKLGYSEADIVQTSFNGLQDVDLVLLEKKLLKGSR